MKYALVLSILVLAGCDTRPIVSPPSERKPLAIVEVQPTVRRGSDYASAVAPILERFCVDCHDSTIRKGGIAFEEISSSGELDREVWARVADAVRNGSMPPQGNPSPSTAERESIDEWIGNTVFSCVEADQDPGRVTLRRLNRTEYDQTIRALFDFDRNLNLSRGFPSDDVGEGFDRIGDVLAIPPILLEKSLVAADCALDEASSDPRVWSKIMNPPADAIPLRLRKPRFAVRGEPIKRIGRPEPVAVVVEDPEVILLRRAREILRAFADRAFRRPATDEELTRLVGLVEAARREGDDFDSAVRFALKGVLISPHFLFLVEETSANVVANLPEPLDDFALASRLSYFLESGPPDDELYALATQGKLRHGENLASQARRLLRGSRSHVFVEDFVVQWLQIRALNDVMPDPQQFPDFDESLRHAMIEETRRFAGSILTDDRSVIDLLDADFTFVNDRLAAHYGIGGVVGAEFRRVSLAGTNRGGILSHASFLTVTSNPTRTSPVKRGKWVLDVLLGFAPLPPPAGVEGLKAVDGSTSSGTIRRQMERHRADPNCATCHARMDPLGFGLENFDAIGAWRQTDNGETIDASGTLPGGETFDGPAGLRKALRSQGERFVRCLAEKLLAYALGRGLRPTDRCFVDEIVRKSRRDGHRFSSLVVAIVESPPFRNRSSLKGEK